MDREQKRVWGLVGCVLAGSVLMAAVCVVGVAGYVLWQMRPAPILGVAPESQAYPDIDRVTVEAAYQAYKDGTAVFVDARNVALYDERLIPGALSIPWEETEARLGEVAPEAWIITYCA